MNRAGQEFAAELIRWQRVHGRHDLPWQTRRDAYAVWVSEIMLQQTQVATVLAYYPRFMDRFPDVSALAAATLDEVLGLWSGLGYYSRARNLHRCAREVVGRHGGRFPVSAAELARLPGIGRSTAAAIAAFCFGERVAILDGNVKRVLTRVLGIGDDLSRSCHERALWARAEAMLPTIGGRGAISAYTQGLMDLGATVCTRTRPACDRCPMKGRCKAAAEGSPERYPVKTRRVARRHQSLWLLHCVDTKGRVWLMTRPLSGVWAQLRCLPVFDTREAALALLAEEHRAQMREHPPVAHALTHRDLRLHFVSVPMNAIPAGLGDGRWWDRDAWQALGLPAPVRRFLDEQGSEGGDSRGGGS